MKKSSVFAVPLIAAMSSYCPASHTQETPPPLEEIVVSAALSEADSNRISATVFTEALVQDRAAQHLEDLMSAAPNLNTASGASRGRFFQIRGIGERSQYIEPVNASVALLLDGIDYTGLGAVATLWDIEQVEILRGPQGTLLGANALAGLINMRSKAADDQADLKVIAGIESDGGARLGMAGGGALNSHWNGRVSAQQYRSDGHIDNRWLNRDDTNDLNELTVRAQLSGHFDAGTLDLNLHYFDIDNGFDAFSLDNTRETLSDQPGVDRTESQAASLRWTANGARVWSAQLSVAQTDAVYAYDEDWSYVGIRPYWEYSSYDQYARDRDMASFEIRTEGGSHQTAWVAGVYLRTEEETLARTYTYLNAPFNSTLNTETAAVFGQIDVQISANLSAFAGLRLERRDIDYDDNAGVTEGFGDTLWSGRIGIAWEPNAQNHFYLSVSRGVRAGGVNANLLASLEALPTDARTAFSTLGSFEEESLISTELGWRWVGPEGRWQSDFTLFNMDRRDQQAKQSLTVPRPDGSTAFIDHTDNAARGTNRGVEWQVRVRATDSLSFEGSAGWLKAKFDNYTTAPGEDLSGRDQPQAPSFMGQLAAIWQPLASLTARLEVTAMDSYYFSDRHEARSPSRQLWNGSLEWSQGSWVWRLWGRNLADEDYFVRGFGSFGNDPRKEYITEPYYQYGEPRVLGITLEYQR